MARGKCTVPLAYAAGTLEVLGEVETTPLDPQGEYPRPILDECGRIVDGEARLSGMLLWARERGLDPKSIKIRVYETTDQVGAALWMTDADMDDVLAEEAKST